MAQHNRIKIFDVIGIDGQRVKLRMRRVSRKRFIGVAMYFGIPAREARELAEYVNKKGWCYARALAGLLWAIEECKDEPDKEVSSFFVQMATGE